MISEKKACALFWNIVRSSLSWDEKCAFIGVDGENRYQMCTDRYRLYRLKDVISSENLEPLLPEKDQNPYEYDYMGKFKEYVASCTKEISMPDAKTIRKAMKTLKSCGKCNVYMDMGNGQRLLYFIPLGDKRLRHLWYDFGDLQMTVKAEYLVQALGLFKDARIFCCVDNPKCPLYIANRDGNGDCIITRCRRDSIIACSKLENA